MIEQLFDLTNAFLKRDNNEVRQLQFFTTAQLAKMRDRTKSRNYSPEKDTFRREHARHRDWGLTQRHARKLRRLHATTVTAATAAADAGTTGAATAPAATTAAGARAATATTAASAAATAAASAASSARTSHAASERTARIRTAPRRAA